jgi:NAD(P)-dependent dehydrogenase (short-subunit alcohol dehydrogenase family)
MTRPKATKDSFARVVAITGASAGVGRAAVRAFARAGADIGLIARGADGLEEARKEVEALGHRAAICQADVASWSEVELAAKRIEAELGEIDVWVNNAMTSVFAPFSEITAEEFERTTQVVYLGQVNGTRAALNHMLPRNRGVIVQVGSALAHRGIPLQSAYCGAKHAIKGFTESVRCELLHDGTSVHITEVDLPALNTPQFSWVRSRLPGKPQPVPPIYQPEVAAEAIVWAATHPRRGLLVGRMTYLTVWGNKFVPGLLDKYLARTGYQSQQSPEPAEVGRADNLFAPLPGDRGAHGSFDRRSRGFSLTFKLQSLGLEKLIPHDRRR